jgi:hypothetical protein
LAYAEQQLKHAVKFDSGNLTMKRLLDVVAEQNASSNSTSAR